MWPERGDTGCLVQLSHILGVVDVRSPGKRQWRRYYERGSRGSMRKKRKLGGIKGELLETANGEVGPKCMRSVEHVNEGETEMKRER